jgi:hypothetical protein
MKKVEIIAISKKETTDMFNKYKRICTAAGYKFLIFRHLYSNGWPCNAEAQSGVAQSSIE